MKTKLLILMTFVMFASCSKEEVKKTTDQCTCTRENYHQYFTIYNSKSYMHIDKIDSYVLPCQDEKQQVYYMQGANGDQYYYNIICE